MNIYAYRCPECDFEWEGSDRDNKCPQCGVVGDIIHDQEAKFHQSIDSNPAENEDESSDLSVSETVEKTGMADRRTSIRPQDLRPDIEKLYINSNVKVKEYIEKSLSAIMIEGEEDENIIVKINETGNIEIIKGDRDRSIPWHRLTVEEQQELWNEFNNIIDESGRLGK